MRTRLSLIAALALASSCVVGAPPGFGDGDVWTIPLVAPLEDDVLLVPVSLNDKGPYLFLIDPDSNTSSIDSALVSELGLYSAYGPEEQTEADTNVPTFYADVPKMEAGNLTVRQRKWRVHKVDTYSVGGRRIRGVLGNDIIADSLLFAVDRDAGFVQLAEHDKLSPPPGASKIGFQRIFRRKVAKVKINGTTDLKLHVDFGGRFSRIWLAKMKEAKLPELAVKAKLVDEYGAVQQITTGAIAANIEAGGEAVQGLLVVPYGDKRVDAHDLDGSLGQDYLSRFRVLADWHKKTIWIARRDGDLLKTAPVRIKRWDALFGACAEPGCVKVSLADGGTAPGGGAFGKTVHRDPTLFADPGQPIEETPAEQPAEPSTDQPAQPTPPSGGAPIPPPLQAPRFRVERSADAPELASRQRIEVLLDAVNSEGTSLGLPKIQVTLRGGTNLVEGQLDPGYANAARLEILDVSPLGRTCASGEKCYWIQTKQF